MWTRATPVGGLIWAWLVWAVATSCGGGVWGAPSVEGRLPASRARSFSAAPPGRTGVVGFESFIAEAGVLVRWRTSSEFGVLTYELSRLDPRSGQWTAVNAEPVIATNSLTGAEYQVLDQTAHPFESYTYRLVALDAYNAEQTYGPFRVRAEQPLQTVVLPRDSFEASPQALPEARSVTGSSGQLQTIPLSSLDGSNFIKVTTTNAGLQRITAAALASLTGQSLSSIQAAIASGAFQLSNQGQPVGWLPGAGNSSLLFYAEAYKDNYTAKNFYFLTSQANLPLVVVDGGAPAGDPTTFYTTTLDQESDALNVMSLPLEPEDDYWMWTRLVAGMSFYDTVTLGFNLDHVVQGEGTWAYLYLYVQGANNTAHRVRVDWNGQPLATNDWLGLSPYELAFELPSSWLSEGTNRLTLKALTNSSSSTRSQWYVNRFQVEYPRRYWAAQGTLECRADYNQVVTADGFTSSSITVLDISVPALPVLVTNLAVAKNGSTWRASWLPATGYSRYLAFQATAGIPVDSLTLGRLDGLASPTNAADYIIIAPDSLLSVATNLASHRQQTGLHPRVACLEPLYNEFAFGFPTPHALERFLATAYTQWSLRPRYAVLLGDGTFDYRNLQGKNDNLTPPLLVSTPYGLCCSDSLLGEVNGDGLPEIAVGRLSGRNSDELLMLVNKLKAYEAQPLRSQPLSLLVADTPGPAGDFNGDISAVDGILAGKFSNSVLRASDIPDAATLRAAITNLWNRGTDLVCYSGHGAIDRFGTAGYFTTVEATNLQNTLRCPVVVAITCVAGQYSVPGTDCLSEYLLKGPAGAIAVVAPTGLSWDQEAGQLNSRLVTFLRANTLPCLGDSFRQAEADHLRLDAPLMPVWIYNLLGDPGLHYQVPGDLWINSVAACNNSVRLTWSGGKPPFQLERKTILDPGSTWESVGSPLTNTTALVPLDSPAVFFRVKAAN